MTKIRFDHDHYCEIVEEGDGEEWGYRGTTWNEHFFNGTFETVTNGSYYNIITKIDIKSDKTYYLVVVIYSTGDSFGKDINSSVEYIEMYEDEKMAMNVRDFIETNKDERDLEVPLNNGKPIHLYPPWNGYFENFEEVRVISVKKA